MVEYQANRVEEEASLNDAAVHVGSSIQVASDMVIWCLSGRRNEWCAYDLTAEDSLDEMIGNGGEEGSENGKSQVLSAQWLL